jgi:3-hydroxyisobutyrate dehydrogenase
LNVTHIGTIGLGLLGSALAERFLKNGLRVTGFDVSAEARSRFALVGGSSTADPSAVVNATDTIVLSLPNSDVVANVLHELESHLAGKTIIDTTTGDPDSTANLGKHLKSLGATYVDATIAGSSQQAREGDVVVMAGGEANAVAGCESIFRCFAKRWFHVGPWGSGARMKLVVNLVLGLNRAVLAEGLVFARGLGLDLNATLEILRSGPAYSQAMDFKGRMMIDGDFTPVARLSQHLKDVRLIRDAAGKVGLQLPLSDLHERLLVEAEALGHGDSDNSAIIRALESVAGRARQRPENAP